MIVLNGGSYYPESEDIDYRWVSRTQRDDLIVFVPAATTKSQEEYFLFFKSKMDVYGLTNVEWVDLYVDWQKVREAKVIHIAGGNTYKLIDIMRKSGFADFIQEKDSELIIVGNSAGAVVLGNDIRTANSEDIIGIKSYNGLGLVNYSICPHYTEDKDERLTVLANIFNHAVLGITEQAALIIDNTETIVNQIKVFKPSV